MGVADDLGDRTWRADRFAAALAGTVRGADPGALGEVLLNHPSACLGAPMPTSSSTVGASVLAPLHWPTSVRPFTVAMTWMLAEVPGVLVEVAAAARRGRRRLTTGA